MTIDSTTSLGRTTASPPAHLWKLSSWFCFGFCLCCCHFNLQRSLVHCLWFGFGLWPSSSDIGTSRLISRAFANAATRLWKVATRTPQYFGGIIIIIGKTFSLGTITHQLIDFGTRKFTRWYDRLGSSNLPIKMTWPFSTIRGTPNPGFFLGIWFGLGRCKCNIFQLWGFFISFFWRPPTSSATPSTLATTPTSTPSALTSNRHCCSSGGVNMDLTNRSGSILFPPGNSSYTRVADLGLNFPPTS